MRRKTTGTLLFLTLYAGAERWAGAQAAGSDPTPVVPPLPSAAAAAAAEEESPGEPEKGKKKKKKKKKQDGLPTDALGGGFSADSPLDPLADVVDVRGRVLGRGAYEDARLYDFNVTGATSSRDGLNLTVPDARMVLRARLLDVFSMEVDVDFGSGRGRLRDGYVQLKVKPWMVRAGQFKMPLSSFFLDSGWNLPVARRGLLNDILQDHLLLFGRRQGGQVRLQGGGYWDPAITVGVFQSVDWGINEGDPLPYLSPRHLTTVGRLSVKPSGVDVALVGQHRATRTGLMGEVRGYWAAGFDSTGEIDFERTGLRFWAEGFVGSSWLDARPTDDRKALFLTGRALVAWRRGGMSTGAPFLEPFVGAGVLEPDLDVVSDVFLEAVGGVNAGYWRRVRLTLQVEWAEGQQNLPIGYFLTGVVKRQFAVVLQTGAAFY